MNLVRHSLRLLALTLLPGLLAAQSPASVRRAVQSITPADIGRRIGIIADDSMRGRDTPSPELEKVAAYIAGEYRRFGLQSPGVIRGLHQTFAADSIPQCSAPSVHV